MQSILVSDFMDQNPHAIRDTATVHEVVDSLMKEQITGAPVVDAENHLIGFVSEQDCIKELLNDAFYGQESPSVTSVMSKNVKTVEPNSSILTIAESMAKQPPSNFPVCEEGKLVGLISRRLMLKALLESSRNAE